MYFKVFSRFEQKVATLLLQSLPIPKPVRLVRIALAFAWALLRAKGDDWVHGCGTPGGEGGSQGAYKQQRKCCEPKCEWVERRDSEKEGFW